MKRAIGTLALVAVAAGFAPACQGGFGTIGEGHKLVVTIKASTDPTPGSAPCGVKPPNLGTSDSPLNVTIGNPATFCVSVEAHNPDGTIDSTFNHKYVNLTIKPGTVTNLDSRNVELVAGKTQQDVEVPIVGAYGDAHIWADDIGFQPAAPDRNPPPQCSNGIDDNGNHLIDYPADPGCYAPTDDSEDLGSYAAGASEPLHFQSPRIPLVRGYDPTSYGYGNATAFPHQQITIDTGWRGGTNYEFSTVVIGLTAAGFYVQDLQNGPTDKPTGYNGLYAYNFSTPPFMRVCDRVQILGGTSSDFYGYTELNYPTWQLEFWNPMDRPCLVPEPTLVGPTDLNNSNRLWQLEATLVRVETEGTTEVHVAHHFGPGNVPVDNAHCLSGQMQPCYIPDATHSNCDLDHSGKIDFTNPQESACAAACAGSCSLAPYDTECSEWSQYESQTDFELIVTDTQQTCSTQTDCSAGYLCQPVNGVNRCHAQARLQASAASANLFNPAAARGQTMRSFTGLLAYFSGGCQFTSNARCQDDVISDLSQQPMPSNQACVHPRTLSDINSSTQ
jgi:hypothetical protein